MKDKIKCPNCSYKFDVEEALSGELQAHYKKEFEKKIAEQTEVFKKEKAILEKEREEFESKKERENELFKERLEQRLAKEKQKIENKTKEDFEAHINMLKEENEKRKSENKELKAKELDLLRRENELKEKAEEQELNVQKLVLEKQKEIEKKAKEDFEVQLNMLKEENEKRKSENKELKAKELDLLRRENELKERAEEQELNVQKLMLEKQKEIEEKAVKKEREAGVLKEREYQKQLEDQKKLIEEMKRKAEQGSMQMQGEVQELALMELLKMTFPYDEITEVPKGIRGADVIQTVVNSNQAKCGKIVFESKRTKNFDKKWIEKLKQDQLRVNGDIAVLVTETLPSDMDRFDNREGIWICHFNEVKSLTKVLREILIKTENAITVQENKGDKMELLYNYLTGNDFIQKIKRIVENYDMMIDQLNSEKKATFRMWSQREKQIWVVQENINALFGDIKGIAGNSIENTEIMDLPAPEIDQ